MIHGKVVCTYCTSLVSLDWVDKEIEKLGPSVPALKKIMSRHGWGNGYLGVPKGHPWFGKGIWEIDCDVHGGLTYADDKMPTSGPDGKPLMEDSEYWWIGFDTNHGFETKRTWGVRKVRAEVMRLMDQAIEAAELRPYDPFDL